MFLERLLYVGGTAAMYFGGFIKILLFLAALGLLSVVRVRYHRRENEVQ